ncbi:MAG: DinB family protein [Saprospiraceae bacterium]
MSNRLLARNAAYQKQVENLLDALASHDDATLNLRPPNGGWSVVQVMHHLIVSEELSYRYVQKKLSFNPELKNAGLVEWLREQLLWFYLHVPIKFKAPTIVSDENLPEYATLTETQARWLKAREAWVIFFNNLPPEIAQKVVYRHPLAGRLGWSGLITFFTTHFNRHLKQIHRTLAQAV